MSDTDKPGVKKGTVDGQMVERFTPNEQRQEDARQGTKTALKKTNSLANFFRFFGIGTRDRP